MVEYGYITAKNNFHHMAKIQFVIGLDVDLYKTIEKIRGKTPRASFINNKLRDVMSDYLPQQTDTTASHIPIKDGVPAHE